MSHGCVFALEDIVQEYAVAGIFGDGEADRVGEAARRHAGAAASVTKVAEIAQQRVIGHELLAVGATGPAEATTEWQAMRERPSDRECSFRREEVRTGHNRPILVLASRIV